MKNKVRIIAGEWRSRIITFPENADLRPTPGRVRETVFNWLGQDMSGRCCLDLFAGSGAMGFEAASRGAMKVVMVESNPGIMAMLRTSLRKLGGGQVELVAMDVSNFIDSDHRRFDLIFLDPPIGWGCCPNCYRDSIPTLPSTGSSMWKTTRFLSLALGGRYGARGTRGRCFINF